MHKGGDVDDVVQDVLCAIESLNHQQSLQSLVHLGVRSELELEDSCGGWDATCD